MICFNCKRQIPDNVPNCPNCGAPINPPEQIGKEIRFRRWQRWIFYIIFIFLFLGAVAFAVYIYSQNTALLNTSIGLKTTLTQAQEDLLASQSNLAAKNSQLEQVQTQVSRLQQDVAAKQAQIDQKLQEVQAINANSQSLASQQASQLSGLLAIIEPQLFQNMQTVGTGIALKDLLRIPVGGYDPWSSASKTIDTRFAASQNGKILILVPGGQNAWYVKDGKRYYIGRPSEAVKLLQSIKSSVATSTAAAASQPATTTQPAR